MTEVNDITEEQFEKIVWDNLSPKAKAARIIGSDAFSKLNLEKISFPKEFLDNTPTKLRPKINGDDIIDDSNGYKPDTMIIDDPIPTVSDIINSNEIDPKIKELAGSASALPYHQCIGKFTPKKTEFIDRDIYDELRTDWENIWPGKRAKVYQEYSRVAKRCKFFVKHGLPYLRGKDVLEIGANAGLQGYHIDQVAASYLGIEPGNKISLNPNPKTDYFLQAKKTEERMSENGRFENLTIREFIEVRNKYKFNAFFASFALYHFTDFELNRLSECIFPECDVVVIQTRHQRRPTKHNKWKLWKPTQVERYFSRLGFKCHTMNEVEVGEFSHKRPKPNNGFSLQICLRPEYQC